MAVEDRVKRKKKDSSKSRLWLLLCVAVMAFLCLLLLGSLWRGSLEDQAHRVPAYEKVNLTPILERAAGAKSGKTGGWS